VVRTRVGYAGGTTTDPTYHRLGDYTETVEIDYDPSVISYEQLLAVFWRNHHPGAPAWSRQYRAVIFYHNDRQKELALKSREQVAARLGCPVYTEIRPAGHFYLAEGYHQKYYLRQMPDLLAEFTAIYPTPEALVASTAAARVNGFLAGYGSPTEVRQDLDRLGLSAAAQRRLTDLVAVSQRFRSGPGCPVPRQPQGG
jgi:peptide-methionine (S)-S-oxide reductase